MCFRRSLLLAQRQAVEPAASLEQCGAVHRIMALVWGKHPSGRTSGGTRASLPHYHPHSSVPAQLRFLCHRPGLLKQPMGRFRAWELSGKIRAWVLTNGMSFGEGKANSQPSQFAGSSTVFHALGYFCLTPHYGSYPGGVTEVYSSHAQS